VNDFGYMYCNAITYSLNLYPNSTANGSWEYYCMASKYMAIAKLAWIADN
jgi:hypothetical protein